jgi:hypothetical protein
LPPSANLAKESLEAVAREINELERLCVELDSALNARDWDRMNRIIADSRTVRFAMEEAMAQAAPYRDSRFDNAVFSRLQQIYAYRQDRLNTLTELNGEIRERLQQISRWKGYARSVGAQKLPPRLNAVDGLR